MDRLADLFSSIKVSLPEQSNSKRFGPHSLEGLELTGAVYLKEPSKKVILTEGYRSDTKQVK